ncbi:MAG: cytochrome c oxidase subunit 3 [Planctomycetota bacterium]|jgi:cytochrome c oxidase subunit 3
MTHEPAITPHILHDRPAHLAHHFDHPQQQFEAAKLGMWMFLATEVLLFGGLFCAYSVFRANHPALFAYGSRFLDTTWGAINTVVLILSSVTMAIAVWCAQCGRQRGLILFLGLTLMLAVDFLGIKYVEYSHKFHDNLVWGLNFYEDPLPGAFRGQRETIAAAPEPVALEPGDAVKGRDLYLRTCLACHGLSGAGLPGLGKPLRTSEFLAGLDDTGLLGFLNRGRSKGDPLNTTGVAMLPKGGNPSLKNQDLLHIIAYLRLLQEEAGATALQETARELVIPRSVIPPPAPGPAGLAARWDAFEQPPEASERESHLVRGLDQTPPDNAHLFFGLYFGMTGLHGLHVVAGMIVITWLLIRSARGHFNGGYFTPVDLGGLYWHIVDLIWIFLFPLLYLIR